MPIGAPYSGLRAPIASPTFTGTATTPKLAVSGGTGSTSAIALIGGNASGAPTSGAHTVGDVAEGLDGHLFVCTASGTPGTWVEAGSGTYATHPGRGLARFMFKLYSGLNVVVSAAGDSVLEGSTASVPGTNDCLSLIKSSLQTSWGHTVTINNRAHSGRTVASWTKTDWATLLTDNADLYIFSFCKNDIVFDVSAGAAVLQGYQRDAAMSALETHIREIRRKQPTADILILTENPYAAASTTSNAASLLWARDLGRLASAYDCEFADGDAAFRALGSWDSYLSDGTHPNDAGHLLLANTVLARMPSTWTPSIAQQHRGRTGPADPPVNGYLYTPRAVGQAGMQTMAVTSAGTNAARLNKSGAPSGSGAGSWSGSGPWTSSTAGDSIHAVFPGCEAYLTLTLGVGQGVVDIYVDGIKQYASADLSTMTNGKLLTLHGLGLGWHTVTVTVVSGSVTYTSLTYLPNRGEWINYDQGRVTSTSMGTPGGGFALFPQGNAALTANGGSLALTFVGTGISMLIWRSGAGGGSYFTGSSVTVDGAAVTITPVDSTEVGYGAKTIVSGLTYGKHTLTMNFQAGGLYIAGFSTWDEQAHLRPGHQEGYAKSGDVIAFNTPFPTIPVVTGRGFSSSTSALITASSLATTGFTMGGPSGESGWWQADAPDLAGANVAGF